MKLLKSFLVISFTLIPFTNFAQQLVRVEKSFIEVCFSNGENLQDLARVQTELSEKDVQLYYDLLTFDKNGKLTSIEYHVVSGRSSASDKADGPIFDIGFIINTAPNKKYDLIAGTKEQIERRQNELEKIN